MVGMAQTASAVGSRAYYGAVGNGETPALVGLDLAVDWLCVPRFDGYPVFARALDPQRGGSLALRWGEGREIRPVAQRYLDRTNILVTEAYNDGLLVRAVDYMPWDGRHLTRVLTVTNVDSAPRQEWLEVLATSTRSSLWPQPDPPIHQGGVGPALLTAPGAALAYGFRGNAGPGARVRLDLLPGRSRRLVLTVAYGQTPEEAIGNWYRARSGDLLMEEAFWRRWLSQAARPPVRDRRLREAYWRSLLVIKLLCHRDSGAILAAPTASFPAVPGGHDNWDYRFCWIRDGYLCARALDAAGLHAEARAFYEFAFRVQNPDGHWDYPLYTLDGGGPEEQVAPDLSGPGGEQPIRFGNAAYQQLQIDSEPSVLLGLWNHAVATGDWNYIRSRWDAISRAAETVRRLWQEPENGIWEIRERRDAWLYGKALCAAGLMAAAEMARALGQMEQAEAWQAEAQLIRAEVLTLGWHEERQVFLQTYTPGSPLDISVLALGLWGLLPPRDPRLVATVKAMERPLRRPAVPGPGHGSTDTPFFGQSLPDGGGLNLCGGIARYDYAAVPFYLPTLWLARYHLYCGRRQETLRLLRVCLSSATSLGLMAEHFDPTTGRQWGNFPQAFNHAELALLLLEMRRGQAAVPPPAPTTWTRWRAG